MKPGGLECEVLVQAFRKQVEQSGARGDFRTQHENDPKWRSMEDLDSLPVTSWPSLETYAAFKRYWNVSIRVSILSDYSQWEKDHDQWFATLRSSLRCAAKP
jgi:hypothetical protein